jgi:hypothetical protein
VELRVPGEGEGWESVEVEEVASAKGSCNRTATRRRK